MAVIGGPNFNNFNQPQVGFQGFGAVPNMTGLGPVGFGPGDQSQFSAEAGQGEGLGANAAALLQALSGMDPKQIRIMELQQGIAITSAALQQAQAQGDQPRAQQLEQQLQAMQAELQQLQGGDQQQAQQAQQAGGGNDGGAPSGGGGGGGGGGEGSGAVGSGGDGGGTAPTHSGGAQSSGGAQETSGANETSGTPSVNSPALSADDEAKAAALEDQLKGTPLEGQGLGKDFVAAGKQFNVDPHALMAISKHETANGKLGVGVTKHMGVGAYDNNPNGKTPFDGARQQIYSGAKTFANLRAKGGATADDPMSTQLSAVNKAGWATDKNWHNGVEKAYNGTVAKAEKYQAAHPTAKDTATTPTSSDTSKSSSSSSSAASSSSKSSGSSGSSGSSSSSSSGGTSSSSSSSKK